MTESLTTFFDTTPINHWSSVVVLILTLISITYTVYFFFSKEGKDECGKHIVSTAVFVSLIVTVIAISIYGNVFYTIVTSSPTAFKLYVANYYWI